MSIKVMKDIFFEQEIFELNIFKKRSAQVGLVFAFRFITADEHILYLLLLYLS